MKSLTAIALALILFSPVALRAQDFQALLGGKDVPTALLAKDLNAEWRRVAISPPGGQPDGQGDMLKQLMQLGAMDGGKGDAMGAVFAMSMFGGLFSGGAGGSGGPTVYYTQGKTVGVAGETFLVAYRFEPPAPNLVQLVMEAEKNGGKEPDIEKLMEQGKMTPESLLTLSLVNVRSIGAISRVRTFDLQTEIAESAAGAMPGWLALMGMRSQPEQSPPRATVDDSPAQAPPAKPAGKPAAKPGGKPAGK